MVELKMANKPEADNARKALENFISKST